MELEDNSRPGNGDKSIASDLNLKYRNAKAGSDKINPSMSNNQTKSIEFTDGRNSKAIGNLRSEQVSDRRSNSKSRDTTPKARNEPR